MAKRNNWFLYETEDGGVFNSEQLRQFKAVIFNNSTGPVLNEEQQQALAQYVEAGATAQEICFEDFAMKVGRPLEQALKTAKGDKEIDSLYNLADIAQQKLVGCQMPNFTANTHSGKPMSRASLKGKVVVMNFWFIGCKPCVAEMPALNRLAERYKAENVVFVAFGDDAQKPATQTFLRNHPFDYQHVANQNKFSDLFAVSSWPSNLVFDQSGKLVYLSHGGFIDERAKTEMYDKLTPIIDGLLSKK